MAAVSLAAGAELDIVSSAELRQELDRLRSELADPGERLRRLTSAPIFNAAGVATGSLGFCSAAYCWDLRSMVVVAPAAATLVSVYVAADLSSLSPFELAWMEALVTPAVFAQRWKDQVLCDGGQLVAVQVTATAAQAGQSVTVAAYVGERKRGPKDRA